MDKYIYIYYEFYKREFLSNLLLSNFAANKNFKIYIGSNNVFNLLRKKKLISPGIFHTKSLTPGIRKIASHQSMIDSGFIITSIDEEGGLVDYGYDKFAKIRYSEQTIHQASAIFGWGNEDVETLKKIYPNYS